MNEDLRKLSRVLHCPNRWRIIEILDKKDRTTGELEELLKKMPRGKGMGHGRGHGHVFGPNLYYHLTALKNADIIEMAGYKEEKGGAPEKIWKLKKRQIVIDLV